MWAYFYIKISLKNQKEIFKYRIIVAAEALFLFFCFFVFLLFIYLFILSRNQ